MIHWNSWWAARDGTKPVDGTWAGLTPRDAASWTPEGWFSWQMNLWNQSLEASLAWWRLVGGTLPATPWLQSVSEPQPAAEPLAIEPPPEQDPPQRARATAGRRANGTAGFRSAASPPPQ